MDRGDYQKLQPIARGQKLLDAAQHYPCAWCGRQNDGTVVAAHCNELALGRGFAHKTPDFMVAYLCNICHDVVDGRAGGLGKEERRAMWCRAYAQTMKWLFEDRRVEIA